MYLHKQIFELCYYGNGFTISDIYSLPIRIRNYYYRQLSDAKKAESKSVSDSTKNTKSPKSAGSKVRIN